MFIERTKFKSQMKLITDYKQTKTTTFYIVFSKVFYKETNRATFLERYISSSTNYLFGHHKYT